MSEFKNTVSTMMILVAFVALNLILIGAETGYYGQQPEMIVAYGRFLIGCEIIGFGIGLCIGMGLISLAMLSIRPRYNLGFWDTWCIVRRELALSIETLATKLEVAETWKAKNDLFWEFIADPITFDEECGSVKVHLV